MACKTKIKGFESSLQDANSYSSSFVHESLGEIELVVGVSFSLSEKSSKRSSDSTLEPRDFSHERFRYVVSKEAGRWRNDREKMVTSTKCTRYGSGSRAEP